MKKTRLTAFVLTLFLCLAAAGCSNGQDTALFDQALPEAIERVTASGFSNGSELEPRELTQAEIGELRAWIDRLSLEHQTYAKGKAPNEAWNGGTSYRFDINGGALVFSWIFTDKTYIQCDGEWYEITNGLNPPLDWPA